MDHLFNSAVRVEELQLVVTDGRPVMDWVQATHDDPALNAMLQYLRCRLDMVFVRPGKDVLPAYEAGKAPDRIGIMFTYSYAPIKAGQRIVAIPNEMNKIPVPGTFEIKVMPDIPQDYMDGHHIEVQIIEANQTLNESNWHDDDPIPGDEDFPEPPDEPEEPTP
jgi:hypothetical protein